MGSFLLILLIAVSLSMDAFSLAIVYGTYGLSRKNIFIISSIVGIFHFFMPIFGLLFGNMIMEYFLFSINLVISIIFGIIGISMIISGIREEDVSLIVSFFGFLLFGLSVSIDSFSVGTGLSFISDDYLFVSFVFMVISGIFTYIGLIFGNSLNKNFGRYANYVGGIMMIGIAFYYYFNL